MFKFNCPSHKVNPCPPLSFAVSVEGKEYTCVVERTLVPRKSEYKCCGTKSINASVPEDFAVLMSYIDKSGRIAYQQGFYGTEARSLLNQKRASNCPFTQDLVAVPFDVRFVKRMAKRAMTTRLESLRLDGKRKAAYGWGISNGRKRTSVTTR